MSLTSVMHKAGLYNIDLLEIYSQHAEPEVLSSLDLTAFKVRVVVMETGMHDTAKDVALQNILSRNDLVYHDSVAGNTWYARV